MNCQISRPENIIASIAAVSTKTVWTSALRANWPRFQASSSRFGVACSVFSPSCASAMAARDLARPQELGDAEHVLRQSLQVIDDVLGHELHGQAKHTQSNKNANGKTLGKNIHLRHRPPQHREDQRNDEG